MDPGSRLDAGRAAAAEGRFEDALREYLWFHDHALEVQRAYYGVRLSFALSYWRELGEKYPPALEALRSVRDRKTEQLVAGQGTREVFHDVKAINGTLDENARTRALFRRLVEFHPDLATSCADLALPVLVEAGEYQLAARYLPDVEAEIRRLADRLNSSTASLSAMPPPDSPREREMREVMSATDAELFADRVRLLTVVMRNTGQDEEAARLRALAVTSVADGAARERVRVLLSEADAGRRPTVAVLTERANLMLDAWDDQLLTSDQLRAWAESELRTIADPKSVPTWLLDLLQFGPDRFSEASHSWRRRGGFEIRFAMHAIFVDFDDRGSVERFACWLARAAMGEDLAAPEVVLGYEVDHCLDDLADLDLAVECIREGLPALLPGCRAAIARILGGL